MLHLPRAARRREQRKVTALAGVSTSLCGPRDHIVRRGLFWAEPLGHRQRLPGECACSRGPGPSYRVGRMVSGVQVPQPMTRGFGGRLVDAPRHGPSSVDMTEESVIGRCAFGARRVFARRIASTVTAARHNRSSCSVPRCSIVSTKLAGQRRGRHK